MKGAAFALLAALAGCAAAPHVTAPMPGPTYTRAQIADLPTEALDLVLLHLEEAGYWQVRMIDLGRPGATVLLSAAGWAVQ